MNFNCLNTTALVKLQLLMLILSNINVHSNGRAFSKNKYKNKVLLDKALFALEKLIVYYQRSYQTVNIDSLLGLRISQGLLQKVLRDNGYDLNGKSKKANKNISLIQKMYNSVTYISEKAQPFVREDNTLAFEKFYKIVSKPWQVFRKFRKLNLLAVQKKHLKDIKFDGPTSDKCISHLLDDKKGHNSCNTSDLCWEFETQQDVKGYTPTHQVLYFLFGLGEGCETPFNAKFRKNGWKSGVQDFFHEICGNIWQTALDMSDDANLLEVEKDLFMEQALVCSVAGYEDFLNKNFFHMILQWQTYQGCFGREVSRQPSQGTTRKLLYYKWLEDGCMNHETGVAVALLAQYIRWFIGQ